MKPLMKWALFLAVPVLLMLAVSAAASAPPGGKVKWTNAGIETVAMDGSRVAYSTELNAVYSWDIRSGRSTHLARPSSSSWPLVHEVAIAGQRVAWIARDVAGNSAETNEDLYTASVTGSGVKKLGHAFHALDFIEPQPTRGVWLWRGDWITGLAGSGKLLAVSRWTTTPTQQGETTISNPRLSLISATTGLLHPIAAGAPSIVSRSVAGGRVAVLRPQGSVGIYSAAGTLLHEIETPTAKEIALSGDSLAVLTTTKMLTVYNWRSGRRVHAWRVPSVGPVHLEDVYAGTAVYSVYSHGRNLHLLQLSTGKDLLLVKGAGLADLGFTEGSHDAQLEAPGLVYAASKLGGGKLVFVPMARVLRAVSEGHVLSAVSSHSSAALKRNGDILYVGSGRLLYLIRPDGTHRRPIAGARNVWSPAWSPDGRWIVYGRTRTIGGLCAQLYVIRADGTRGRRLTHDGSCYRDPAWSPVGQRIVFAKQGALGKDSIWTMKLDGSGLRLLTDDGDNPAWSPDGTTIAFERGVLARAIWLMDANGANQRQLTMPVQRLGGHSDQDFQPDWSPKGTQIAFSRLHPANRTFVSDIYVVRRDGSGLRVLTRPRARGTMPGWSPDGRRLVLVRWLAHGGSGGIYVMKADGSRQTRLTKGNDNEWPDWGPATKSRPAGELMGRAQP